MLNHVLSGNPEGPHLLLIHPMGADLDSWRAFSSILDPTCRSVAVDLRGAGHSPALDRPMPIDGHARDLVAFCAEQGLDRVVVVGCAVGAMVAAVLAGMRPDLCSAAVLCNPGFRTLPGARDALSKRAAMARANGMAAVVPAATDAAFAGCPDDDRRRAYVERFAMQYPEQYALQIEGMLDADTSPYLGPIDAPTLIVAGGRDVLLPPADHAAHLAERIAGAEYVLVAEGAHFIPYQRPATFAALVADFLDRRVIP